MDLNGEHFKAYVFIEMKRGKLPSEIIEQLKESGVDNVPGNSTIYPWVKQFKDGTRTSLIDARRSGHPCSTTTADNIQLIQRIIDEEPKQSVRCISTIFN